MKKAISVSAFIAIVVFAIYWLNNSLALTASEYRNSVEYQNAQIDSLKTMVRMANTKLDSLQCEVIRISEKADSINTKADMILYYQKQEAENRNNSDSRTFKLW